MEGKGFDPGQHPGEPRRDRVRGIEGEPRKEAGVTHFGFRLVDPKDIDAAATAIERAGGKVVERGEFVPGEPYVFATDPDGYTIEVWYE